MPASIMPLFVSNPSVSVISATALAKEPENAYLYLDQVINAGRRRPHWNLGVDFILIGLDCLMALHRALLHPSERFVVLCKNDIPQ